MTKELEQVLTGTIRENGNLQALRQKRRKDELEAKIGNNQQAQQIFNKIVRKSPILSKLLITGEKVLNPYAAQDKEGGGKKEFKPSHSPTFLKFLRPNSEESPRPAEVGRTARVQLGTDAPNDYLIRSLDQGTFLLSCNESDFHWQINPYDGVWTLNITIPDTYPIGKKLTFKCTLGDGTMAAPLEVSFWLSTIAYTAQDHHGDGQKKKKNPNQGNGQNGPSPGLALPNIVDVRKAEWAAHDFNQHSALKVTDTGDGTFDFFVNMDNIYLANEVSGAKTDKIILENRFKLALVFIGVAILAEDNSTTSDDSNAIADESSNELSRTQLVQQVSEWVSPIVLPLINELSGDEFSNENFMEPVEQGN